MHIPHFASRPSFPVFPCPSARRLAAQCGGLLWLLMVLPCAAQSGLLTASAADAPVDAVYTVRAADGVNTLRAVTAAALCPAVRFDAGPPTPMALRVGPATVPARPASAGGDSKPSVFGVRTCELAWPVDAHRAELGGQVLAAPARTIRHIVIIADTGCRMKGAESAFQACNDPQSWPFARVAASAAARKPDLIVHLGDLHYRESPCDSNKADCTGSVWGYGYDAWQADFFIPARPLLAAAPWVFVRGNHEICARAGQGWFRFVDSQAWRPERSCNDPAQDSEADFSAPYGVALDPDTQFVVFDSSRTSGKALHVGDAAFAHYAGELQQAEQLAALRPHNIFLSHHPLLAFAPARTPGQLTPGGNAGLQSVFAASQGERLLPPSFSFSMHGHIHLFEAMSFQGAQAASFVLGNSGSAEVGDAPERADVGTAVYTNALLEDYVGQTERGFATLDRSDSAAAGAAGEWTLTEFDSTGQPRIRCELVGHKSHCTHLQK